MSIRNFNDHAANERTFLAWVRTAVALMAFGFLIERFDLFLRFQRSQVATTARQLRIGQLAGFALMIAGLLLLAVATWRFLKTTREIDSETEYEGPGARFDVALAALLFVLGLALLGYLVFTLLVG